MTFSVAKSRPLRVFGLYRSSGKHAAPRGTVQRAIVPPRRATRDSLPRLTDQQASGKNAALRGHACRLTQTAGRPRRCCLRSATVQCCPGLLSG